VKDRFTISRDKLQEHIVSANEQPESWRHHHVLLCN
jgi:hypothetical protein